MNYTVRITSRAHAELATTIEWYAEHYSAEFAARWYDEFLDRIDTLASTAESNPFSRENDRVPFDLRELHYGAGRRTTHRAVFRILESTVEVLTIRHVAQRDLEADELT